MTDSKMTKIFESLADPANGLNETELAISMLVALEMARKEEIANAKTVMSER